MAEDIKPGAIIFYNKSENFMEVINKKTTIEYSDAGDQKLRCVMTIEFEVDGIIKDDPFDPETVGTEFDVMYAPFDAGTRRCSGVSLNTEAITHERTFAGPNNTLVPPAKVDVSFKLLDYGKDRWGDPPKDRWGIIS